jgi:hypothetical protein
MKTPEEMKQAAVDLANEILSRRLKRGGIQPTRPEFYFQCEPGEHREYEGGNEVRVKVWRHWSDAFVSFDGDKKQLLGCAINRYSDPPSEKEISKAEALAAVVKTMELPPDAVLESFYHYEYAPGRKVARLSWEHVHEGLRVDGDVFWVVLHPATLEIIEYFRKWRIVDIR